MAVRWFPEARGVAREDVTMSRSTVLPGIAALLLSAALVVPASAAQRVTPAIGVAAYPHGPGSNAVRPDGRHREGGWRQVETRGEAAAGTDDGAERQDGKWRGRGTYTFSDGGRYEGEWLAGKPHGQGIRTWPDGNRYELSLIHI